MIAQRQGERVAVMALGRHQARQEALDADLTFEAADVYRRPFVVESVRIAQFMPIIRRRGHGWTTFYLAPVEWRTTTRWRWL